MFVSRKEFNDLKNKVDQQEAIIHNLIYELEQKKEQEKSPVYLG